MGFFADYVEGVAMRKNPALLKQKIANINAQNMRDTMSEMYGSAGQEEQRAPYAMGSDEMMEGEMPIQGLQDVTQEATPGTGLIGGASSPEEQRYLQAQKVLGMSGQGEGVRQQSARLGDMQDSIMQGVNQRSKAPGQRTTFEVGAGNGLVQRAYLGPQSQVVPLGEPYRPFAPNAQTSYEQKRNDLMSGDERRVASAREAMRDQYKQTDLGYVDPNDPDAYIDRERAKGKFVVGMAEADTNFYKNYGKATQTLENTAWDIQRTVNDLQQLSGLTDYSTTGFAGWLDIVPTTDAKQWATLRDTVTSNLSLDKLMQLKSLSATGASGFGALSEKELKVLTDHLGNLENTNDPKVIKSTIKKIVRSLERNKRSVGKALKRNANRYKLIDKRFDRYTNKNRTEEGVMQSQEAPNRPPPPPGFR